NYWEDPTTGPALAALLRSAMTNAEAAVLLREFVVHELFARMATSLDTDGPNLRLELAAAQLVGVAVLRNILHVEPIASASIDERVPGVGPPLDGSRRPRPGAAQPAPAAAH